jgi:hypothetical protein
MKTLQKTQYQCETCQAIYDTEAEAVKCESREVTQDRGVKLGDEVLITGGEGKGHRCKVDNITIVTKDWGHYAWERYWHTVAVSGEVIGSWGSRFLPYDSYETLP